MRLMRGASVESGVCRVLFGVGNGQAKSRKSSQRKNSHPFGLLSVDQRPRGHITT